MLLENLTELSGDEWEALTEQQLAEWAARFQHITRPDPALYKQPKKQTVKHSTSAQRRPTIQTSKVAANKAIHELSKLATQLGFTLPDGLNNK